MGWPGPETRADVTDSLMSVLKSTGSIAISRD